MHNFWLKKKDICVKNVDIIFKDGQRNVYIELNCGRTFLCKKYLCENGESRLEVRNLSYEDTRFYTLQELPGGTCDAVPTEPWNEAVFSERYRIVEKTAIQILKDELDPAWVEDMQDYYDFEL